MNRNRLKIQFLSPMYMVQTAIMLPLLWATSSSFRQMLHQKQALFRRRPLWVLLRILGKHGAMELGFTLPVVMLVLAGLAFAVYPTLPGFIGGATLGFVLLTLLPVAMPMPSRDM